MKCLLFFLALSFYAEKGCSLKCYDSVSTNGSVLIGCNFPGAACGVTQASYFGYSYTNSSPYIVKDTYEARSYFCAHKETSCKSGFGNFCDRTATLMSVLGLAKEDECGTTCCETDKCNKLPEEPEENHHIIGELGSLDKIDLDAKQQSPLRCYVNVNRGQQAVDCLFHDAVCVLYRKEKEKTSLLYSFRSAFTTTTYYEAFQRCGKKAECAERKKALCQTKYGTPISNCVFQCCTSNYCNRLPTNMKYVEGDRPESVFGDISDSNDFWNGLFPTTTTTKPIPSRRRKTKGRHSKTSSEMTTTMPAIAAKKKKGMNLGYDVLTTEAMIVDESFIGGRMDLSPRSPPFTLIAFVVGIVFVIIIMTVITLKSATARKRRPAKRPPQLDQNGYFAATA